MKSVLFVSYDYPPIHSPGSARLAGLARYLPTFGWRPIVLSVKSGYNPSNVPYRLSHDSDVYVARAIDLDPIKRFASRSARGMGTGIGRSERMWDVQGIAGRLKQVYSKLVFPDRDWLWIPGAIVTGLRLIECPDMNISVIYSTSPNMSNHLVARILSCRSGLPWVVEFRDFWAFSSLRPPRSRLRAALETRLERRVCKEACSLVTVTHPYRQRFAEEYDLPYSRTMTVYNGYDPEEFADLDLATVDFPRFTIAHAGSFYSGARKPAPLFRVLKRLSDTRGIKLEDVQLDFYGEYSAEVHEMARDAGVGRIVRWHGFVPRDALFPVLAKSYCLLLVTHRQDDTIPSKLFDYLGCQRPVIALANQDSATHRVVEETVCGHTVAHDDDKEMENVLRFYYSNWKLGKMSRIPQQHLLQYQRSHQARQIAESLTQLTV